MYTTGPGMLQLVTTGPRLVMICADLAAWPGKRRRPGWCTPDVQVTTQKHSQVHNLARLVFFPATAADNLARAWYPWFFNLLAISTRQ